MEAETELFDLEREVLSSVLRHHAGVLAAGDGSPLELLAASRDLRRLLTDVEAGQVRRAREDGASWAAVGDALQISRQAAFQRFSTPGETPIQTLGDAAIPDAGARAQTVLDQFQAADWTALRAGFDPRMTELCTVAVLASLHRRLEADLGARLEMRAPQARMHGDVTVVDVALIFERGTRTGRVAFARDGRVAGFFILAPS